MCSAIAIYKPQDVRPIIEAYHGKDIPIEYGKKEAEAKAQFIEEWKRSGKSQSGGGGFSLSALFGGNQQVGSTFFKNLFISTQLILIYF